MKTSEVAQSAGAPLISNAVEYFEKQEELRLLYDSQIHAMRAAGMREQGPKFREVRAKLDTILSTRRATRIHSSPTTIEEACTLLRRAGERFVETINDVEYAWRWCPAGEFMMGGERSEWSGARSLDKSDAHCVTLSRSFWILETQVTQQMWKSVMGEKPEKWRGDNFPVVCVTWRDSQEFCSRLRAATRLSIQLPTEAQWEYACRAGTTTAFSFGDSCNGSAANCDGMSPWGTPQNGLYVGNTTVVKSYSANPWGLYDMHGNVWEWCSDWYGEYAPVAAIDPKGPDSGTFRVSRGGSWRAAAERCRSAARGCNAPESKIDSLGFRLIFLPSFNYCTDDRNNSEETHTNRS